MATQCADDDHARLLFMINANWMTQAIGTAVALGLPELLTQIPRESSVLAASTGCHEPSLRRLLHALASLGLCSQREGGFAITALGARLHPEATDSLNAWARYRAVRWPAWGELEQSVRSGESWRKRRAGANDFSGFDGDPSAAALLHRAIGNLTRSIATHVARAGGFDGNERIVDVGGGAGALVAAILAAHPAMRGVVVDLEHARPGAVEQFASAGIDGRCEFVASSFFEAVPSGGDVYLLKSVLHNWDDERAELILRRCRDAMSSHARLLVVERIAPENWSVSAEHQSIAASDLNMLVMLSGRERSETEFRALLDTSALSFTRTVPIANEYAIIEATP